MKSFVHKLLASTFVIALAAGCGSVTDAGLDTTQPEAPAVEQTAQQPDDMGFGTEQSQDPIVDRPEDINTNGTEQSQDPIVDRPEDVNIGNNNNNSSN